ncbi:MAG: serine kinase [Pseudomonadota bacterium]
MRSDHDTQHGTAVCINKAGVFIIGASGSGKSSLALQLLALGAELVADDQVALTRVDGAVTMSKPSGLPDKIEARGVGLLDAPTRKSAQLALIVDLDVVETARLPEPSVMTCLGLPITLWRKVDAAYFPAAILLYLRSQA